VAQVRRKATFFVALSPVAAAVMALAQATGVICVMAGRLRRTKMALCVSIGHDRESSLVKQLSVRTHAAESQATLSRGCPPERWL
jgi:hypothetical protein